MTNTFFISLQILTLIGLTTGLFVKSRKLKQIKYKNKRLKERIFQKIETEEQKESFIANLTHDLKSPTSAQMSSLKLLLNGSFGTLTPEQNEILELAQGSCRYVSELISTILDTYKFNRGKIKLIKKRFDIISMICNLKKDFQILAKEKNQIIIFRCEKEHLLVFADKLQIKRVIMNFLSNSITYGKRNSEIIIDLKVRGYNVDFSITNTSEHLNENETSKIFDEFSKTKLSTYNKASTGLGLHLSKQIIEMHRGKIYAKSSAQKCTFGFRIKYQPITSNEKVFEQLLKK